MLSLIALKNYLRNYRRVTLQELSRVFNEEPGAILDLLQFFSRRCDIRTQYLTSASQCTGSCSGCALKQKQMILIEWVASN